jgi:hypothetical protein
MKIFKSGTRFVEKLKISFSFLIRATLLIAMISAVIRERWPVLFISLLAFGLTFLPGLFQRNFMIFLPAEFELVIVLFIYMTLFFGEVQRYYTTVWWWDVVAHSASGIALGFVGFLILYTMLEQKMLKANPVVIAIFSFSFALAIGAIWEIFEFSMDHFFHTNMQKSGLVDTMKDLIMDSLGALFASVIGYLYMKGGKTRIFNRLVTHFVKENPRLFRED